MMARRKNKLVWLIAIPIVVFGLAKGGMYWYVKQKLDQAILEVSHRFTIQYAGLETFLEGRINVNGIEVVPVGQADPLRISQVSIQGPDVLSYLLNHNPVTGDKGPPEYLNINISNMGLDLTTPLTANLDQEYQLSLQQHGGSDSMACNAPGTMTLSMLRDMGYKKLAGDGRVFYRYDKTSKRLKGLVELNLRGLQRLFIEVAFAEVSPQAVKSGSPGIPQLADIRVTMRVPPVFGKKMSLYCAAQTAMTAAEYEERMAGMFMQNLADNGVVLGRGLQLAVRSYYTNWGEIDIIAKPVKPLNLLALMFRPPVNLEETLGLQVAINDRLLTDLDFKLQKGAKLFTAKPQQKKKPVVPKPIYKMVWKKIPVVNLGQYLYHDVRLHMRDQPARHGLLTGINDGSLSVEQRVNGGKFTAHVLVPDVAGAEARIRIRLNPPSTPPKEGKAEKADTQQTEGAAQQG